MMNTAQKLLSLAVVTLSSGVIAGEVQVYGVIDSGVLVAKPSQKLTSTRTQGRVSSTTVERTGDTTYSMNSGITKGSRWGLTGSESLGNGYSIGFKLEAGFDMDTGAEADSDRIFNRNSYLSLSAPWGNLKFGRLGTLASGNEGGIFASRVSPFGITWNLAQATQILSGATGARVNNQIRYESPEFMGSKVYLQYSNGIEEDDLKNSEKTRYGAVGLTYNNRNLMLVAVVDKMFYNNLPYDEDISPDGTKGYKDQVTYNVGGTYKFKRMTVFAGYQHGTNVRRFGHVTSGANREVGKDGGYNTNAYLLGLEVKLLGGEVKSVIGYGRAHRGYRDTEGKAFQAALGYIYPLSKRTSVYMGGAFVRSDLTTNYSSSTGKTKYHTKNVTKDKAIFAGILHEF